MNLKASYFVQCVSDAQITKWTVPVAITGASGTGNISTAIAEDSDSGKNLFNVNATGTNASAVVTYAFGTNGNPDGIAAINITTGVVTLAGKLDYDTKSSYVFVIV